MWFIIGFMALLALIIAAAGGAVAEEKSKPITFIIAFIIGMFLVGSATYLTYSVGYQDAQTDAMEADDE